MEPLTLYCLLFGTHILLARCVAGVLSEFPFYFGLGCLEGLPLIGSGVFLQLHLPWAFPIFVVSLVVYFSGSWIRFLLERGAEKRSPDHWQAWARRRETIRGWIKILLFLF
jgi:hypothetical protein